MTPGHRTAARRRPATVTVTAAARLSDTDGWAAGGRRRRAAGRCNSARRRDSGLGPAQTRDSDDEAAGLLTLPAYGGPRPGPSKIRGSLSEARRQAAAARGRGAGGAGEYRDRCRAVTARSR